MIRKIIFFIGFIFTMQSSFAGTNPCTQPVDCETAIACDLYYKMNSGTSTETIIADVIAGNSVCQNFKFDGEHGYNDIKTSNINVSWKTVKNMVINKINTDQKYAKYSFMLYEGDGVGSTISKTLDPVGIFGGGSIFSSSASAVNNEKASPGGITANWNGCVNISNNGKSSNATDLFTRTIIEKIFNNDFTSTYAFNTSNYNLLYKNNDIFMMNQTDKIKFYNVVKANISGSSICTGEIYTLWLYPVKILVKNIDADGNYEYEVWLEGSEPINLGN